MFMRMRKVSLMLVILLVSALSALAQETTGTIKGRVVDSQGLAVPGATVTLTGTQGAKNTATDAEGRFTIPFLTPGTYTVRGELQGFKAVEQPGIAVSLGQTVDLPLKMEVGGLTETVQVTASTPVVNTATTTSGAVMSSDMLKDIPVGRRISDTLYLAPGVSSSGSAGRANPSISGSTGLDNLYVVDGVNITNQGYGALGSYSIVFGSLGNATPFDFVQEVQVKTGGYEAEFGQSTGGVVNVITKSGSNDLHGSVFGYARPKGIEGDYKQFQSVNGTVQTLGTENFDGGAEGGGPIVRNHVFFFGAINPGRETRTFNAPQGFPLLSLGDIDRKRTTLSYSAKGTWQVNNAHRLDASFFGDPSKGAVGPQRVSSLVREETTGFSSLEYGGHNQTVRYNGVMSSSFLLEGSFGRALNRILELPSVDDWTVRDLTGPRTVTTGGIGFYEAGNRSLNNQYAIKATNIFSGHQLRYGFAYDDVNYSQINQRTGPTFRAPDGRQTATGAAIDIVSDVTFGRIFRVTRANFNSGRTTLQKYQTFFIQDTWKAGNHLTINPGIRYEQEKLVGSIVTDFRLKNNWGPRVGATYDVKGDGRSKVFGNFGRYYSRVPNDLAARALSADDGVTRMDYFDAQLTRPIPNGTVTQTTATATPITNHFLLAGVGADVIDPDAKLSYTDEVVGGVEFEVMPHTTFGVRYVYRNIGRVLEDVANCPMVAYEFSAATSSACGTVEYILTNPSTATPINPALLAIAPQFGAVSFDNPLHKYSAIELTLNRRLSNRWSALTSYRWSRLRGNFEGFYRDDNGQSDPGISSLYDFPTNDPIYSTFYGPSSGDIRFLGQDGILPLDRPHQVKVYGNYLFDMGLNVGVGLNFSSGKPLTALAANPSYQNGGEIPLTARGAGIQTIDGSRRRSPFESQADVQASYAINFGGARKLTLLADVFNLLNTRRVTDYDNWTDIGFDSPNDDFGKPISQTVAGPQFQAPRQIRLGARLSF
jgi:hypothetical protein